MIDELVLEDLFAQLAAEIPVPAAGADHLVDDIVNVTKPGRATKHGNRSGLPAGLLVAASIVVLLGILIAVVGSSSTSSSSKSSGVAKAPDAVLSPAKVRDQDGLAYGNAGAGSGGATASTPPDLHGAAKSTTASGASAAPTGPVDSAKIVKTGTLDLRVAHGGIRLAVNRVSAAAVGLGGYVSDSKTNFGGTDPTAEITIRVPVANFDDAVARLHALPGVTVLSDSEHGSDVTAQYVDLQAQLQAATAERDALLVVLSHAQSIGDILAVRDRVSAAQTQVDQLQGRVNLLNGQATFSSLAVTLSEKPLKVTAATHKPKPQTGLAKAWADARHGFSSGVEWLIARSGGALIVLLAALALLFGIRYLYPVVRRGLV